MYSSTTAALPGGDEASEAVRGFAGLLRVQADVVDAARERLRSAVDIDWESPAGRNFRGYLLDRAASLVTAAALLREAAVSLEGYGAALEISEPLTGSGA